MAGSARTMAISEGMGRISRFGNFCECHVPSNEHAVTNLRELIGGHVDQQRLALDPSMCSVACDRPAFNELDRPQARLLEVPPQQEGRDEPGTEREDRQFGVLDRSALHRVAHSCGDPFERTVIHGAPR